MMEIHRLRHFVTASLLLTAIVFGSCRSGKERDRAEYLQRQNDSLQAAIDSMRTEFNLRVVKFADTRTGLWRLDTHSETGRLVFTREYPHATVYDLAKALNAAFRSDSVPQFSITGVRDQTAFVRIPDSERLTQGLGSAGAREYLAQVTLSLTSVPGIRFIEFDFKQGDHASPGRYNRQQFAELIQ